MFERRTVFVVGAGASCELGFPSGGDLKNQIGAKVDIRFHDNMNLSRGDKNIVGAIKAILKDQGERNGNPY
jgi:NAD-dependent SIR2 family protein deacetylase